MKIVAVCGFGVGSSVIAKMNMEQILAQRGEEDIDVETVDLGSVTSVDADLYVTTHELFDQFPESITDKTLVLNNFVDVNEIREQLLPRVDALRDR
ncbi:PTS system, ascorbate-specific IIB component [Propionibacterium cyclohexanicum]|uniref:PTS system, ascorbate-specific IIB component n=1 Tax=Propionibacterium cyclohexanicum TaxID=64702 RepID=A0A1H9QR62_9ACTN|nr:PTS sugar transporter subunit IIB [Propionibacterium cyclohexanicum]SER62910.1 PTS system, ascorbate-specific IIB component [Propionibacterium cyclohexanicum]